MMKAFIELQFGYFPLVWMFCSRTMDARINRIHVRALRIVYNEYVSSFDELLTKDKSFTIHHGNIQTLTIEIYKVINNIYVLKKNCMYNTREIGNMFDPQCPHRTLRYSNFILLRSKNSEYYP